MLVVCVRAKKKKCVVCKCHCKCWVECVLNAFFLSICLSMLLTHVGLCVRGSGASVTYRLLIRAQCYMVRRHHCSWKNGNSIISLRWDTITHSTWWDASEMMKCVRVRPPLSPRVGQCVRWFHLIHLSSHHPRRCILSYFVNATALIMTSALFVAPWRAAPSQSVGRYSKQH